MPELATQTSIEAASESSGGVLSTLGIHGTQFLAQLLNVLILLIALRWLVYKPLLKLMDERATKIREGLETAERAKIQLFETQAERERVILEAKHAARGILEVATAQTETLRKDKLQQAKQEIEKIVGEAKESIATERAEAMKALQRDVADLVVRATAKVLSGVDEKTQRNLLDQAIKKIDTSRV